MSVYVWPGEGEAEKTRVTRGGSFEGQSLREAPFRKVVMQKGVEASVRREQQ